MSELKQGCVVDRETAESDFRRFIETLEIKPRKMEKMDDEKEEVINGIEYGNIKISDAGIVTYVLDDPIKFDDNSDALSEVTFGNRRITVKEMESKMIGKSELEKTRRMFAHMSGKNAGLFEKMKGDDFALISQIAAFFLPR